MQNKISNVTLLLLLIVLATACAPQPTQEGTLIGATATDFTLNNALGGQTSLSDYEGKSVLLYFHMAVG